MTRLHIDIKDSDRTIIVINLLKELPFVEFVEIEESKAVKPARKGKKNLEDLFGLWENRKVSLSAIRKKAWDKNNDSL